jgi:uncharacterized membrane protein
MGYRLNMRKKNLLVSIHVLGAMAWFGGTLGMLILGIYMGNAENGEQLYYTLSSMHMIDGTVIKYPAMVVLITGLMLSVWTHWGLTKHYWVLIKLVTTFLIILLGILFLSDGLSFLIATAEKYHLAALQNASFHRTSVSLTLGAIFNVAAMVMMTLVTYYKPFGKIKRKAKPESR